MVWDGAVAVGGIRTNEWMVEVCCERERVALLPLAHARSHSESDVWRYSSRSEACRLAFSRLSGPGFDKVLLRFQRLGMHFFERGDAVVPFEQGLGVLVHEEL